MQQDNTKNIAAQVFLCQIPNYQNATLQQKPQLQHSWAMLLLKHAYNVAFDLNVENLHPTKLASGKWVCDKHYFSVSHSAGLVCVAVSTQPVGADLQKQTNADATHIARRFFTEKEQATFAQNNCTSDEFFFTWCKKEALWKSLEIQPNTVATVETTNLPFTLLKFCHQGQTFFLATTGNANIQFVQFDQFDKTTTPLKF